jgi:hypothetical protein
MHTSLNEAISAQIQSLARTLAATADPGLSLTTVKDDLERILPEIPRTASTSYVDGEECGRSGRYHLGRLIAKASAAPRSVERSTCPMTAPSSSAILSANPTRFGSSAKNAAGPAPTLDRLISRYGLDTKLFEWTDELTADCPRKQARNEFDPCGAICPDLPKVV